MKDINRKNDWQIARSLADDVTIYLKDKAPTKDILYSLRYENGNYQIHIYKDEENILQSYLERMDE